ncbi:MAG: transglutaminase-like domain-containing protein [Verrucomicrobia bacterium]|nr:transglutaminase-like domain-containing protein [Verrucomicrobiota bacterium]
MNRNDKRLMEHGIPRRDMVTGVSRMSVRTMNTAKGKMIGGGQDARATVARAFCPVPCVIVLLVLLAVSVANAYYDATAGDKQIAYRYLDQVQDDVGFAAFESVSESHALQLALTLGSLDKDHLTSKAFIQHLQQVEKGKDRFYKKRKLTGDEVAAYLLPFRIRYEHTSKPEWLTTLAQHFQPVTASATTADEAAQAVFDWMPGHVKLLEPALSYPLPQRGDLDPLTVLKGGFGSEVDCALFGVAALRASGVAARFVWAPALRGEGGGKAWLEYLSEAGTWVPWVPSFGAAADHAAEIRKQLGPKILFVMARPEAPFEITATYVKTMEIVIHATQENVVVSLLAPGRHELMAARGTDEIKNERQACIGRGAVVVAASFSNRSFALLPIDCPPDQDQILIEADAGNLSITANATTLRK